MSILGDSNSADQFDNTIVTLYDSNNNPITTDSPGTAGNRRLHTAVPDTVTGTTALNALNSRVSIPMAGMSSVGFQISAGTLIGTIVAECSLDGGITWTGVPFYDPSNSTVTQNIIFSSANATKILSILPVGGSSHVSIRVSAYTSGTANSLLRASQVASSAGTVITAAFGTVSNNYYTIPNNTSQILLTANANRKYAYISNNSSHVITIQFGNSTGLTATTGLVIQSNAFYELKGNNLYTGAVYGYSSGGSAAVSVTEGTP